MCKTTKNDLLLAVRKASFITPDALSFMGRIGDEGRIGKLQDAAVKRALIDSTMVRTEMKGVMSGVAFGVESETVEFRDYPVVTLQIALRNDSDQTQTVHFFSCFRREFCGSDPVLFDEEGNRYALPAPPHRHHGEKPQAPENCPALPRFDASRYFLSFEECTVMIESEGAKVFHTEPCGASALLAPQDLTLAPGETISMPKVTILVTEGDVAHAKALYAAFAKAHLA